MTATGLRYGSTVLFVDDVRSVIEFWIRAFGAEQRFYDAGYDFGEIAVGGALVGIASHRSGELMMPGGYRRPPGASPAGVELAFYADDVDAAYARAVGAGAASLAAPRRMEWGQTVAYVRSVEGTVVGLCTQLPG